MSKTPIVTPLLTILRQLETADRRAEFALLAGTDANYLYQLGSCQRRSCRAPLAKAIADASLLMSQKYGCNTISMDELATMCPVP